MSNNIYINYNITEAFSGNTSENPISNLWVDGEVHATNYYGNGSNLTGISGGGSETFDVTYSELYDLIITQTLVPNSTYRLTDYKSYNFINGYTAAQYINSPQTIPPGRIYKEFTNNLGNNSYDFFNGSVYTTEVDDNDGSIYVGGDFDEINGITKNRLIKLNSDGSQNTYFYDNLGDGFDNQINSIAIRDNGNLVVGGNFINYSGLSRTYIVGLLSNGIEDVNFYINLTSTGNNLGFNSSVIAIKIQNDGKILVGGTFTELNGDSRNYLVRLNSDGSEDVDFYNNLLSTGIGTGLFGSVYAIGYDYNDGSIYIGGNFSSLNGNMRNKFLKLNSDGTEDTTFNDNLGNGFISDVFTIEVQSDGKILVGGSFYEFNGVTHNRIIRFNSDGTEDTDFNSNMGTAINNCCFVADIKELEDGSIAVAGGFDFFDGNPRNSNFLKLNSDGYKDFNFKISTGFNGYTRSINQIGDYILVAGDFSTYQDVKVNRIVKFYNIESESDYNGREIYTGETEVLLLKSRSNYEFDSEVLSETYPTDVLEYLPYCNNLGFILGIYNGQTLPDSSEVSGFDLQWDGENVYFEMPLGYPTQFGHYFYIYANFYDQNGDEYYADSMFEPLTPVISTTQYIYSFPNILEKININSGGTKVILVGLTYQNYLEYNLDTLYVETIEPLQNITGWVTKRIDKFRNITVPYDFRGTKYRRYQIDLTYNTPIRNNYLGYWGITDYYFDIITNGNYNDYSTFNEEQPVHNFTWDDMGGPDGGSVYNGFSENIVFLQYVSNINLKSCKNNTISYFTNNNFYYGFSNNIIRSGFYNSTIGVYFQNNILNTIDTNIIEDYFHDNYIESYSFNDNKIGKDFRYNVIYDDFENNLIGENFSFNFIDDDFNNNKITNFFTENSINYVFQSNEISDNFFQNSIYNGFTNNKIGNFFNNNTIGDENNLGYFYFADNEIGGFFKGNNIVQYFSGNRIGFNFKGNQTYGEFSYNEINYGCFYNEFSGYTSYNKISPFFSFNNLFGSFSYNIIGEGFQENDILDGFGYGGSIARGNVIGNNFYNNNIREYFYDNKISDNFQNNTIGDYFQWNTINTSINSFDFTNYYGNITAFTYTSSGTTAVDNTYFGIYLCGATESNGVNASFDVEVSGGLVVGVTGATEGQLYQIDDTLTILGTQIGGVSGAINDFSTNTLTVKIYKPADATYEFPANETEMDYLISNSPLFDTYYSNNVQEVSYSQQTGVDQNYYGMEIDGRIIIPSGNTYYFGLSSDDGSDAFIDGIKVADWYGAHGDNGNNPDGNFYPITLTAGTYSIKVRLQERTGGDVVSLLYGFDGLSWDIIPDSWFVIGKTGVTGTYTNVVAQVVSGIGENATFDINIVDGFINSLVLNNPGNSYSIGDELTILGSAFGGVDGVDDITIIVSHTYSDDVVITVTGVSPIPSVYQTYTCNIFERKGGVKRLSFYDESDILNITDLDQ